MNRYIEYSILIDRYLDGELTPAELKKFKFQLQKNSELANELNMHCQVYEMFTKEEVEIYRKQIKNVRKILAESEVKNEKKVRKRNYSEIIIWGMSAIIFIILLIISYLY